MSIAFGGGSSRQRFPSWTAPLTRWAFQGNTPEEINPNGTGLMSDALMGSNMLPASQAFGGLANQIPGLQLAGHQAQQLGAAATQQGYDNLMALGGHGWNTLNNVNGIAGLVPNGMEASNYYLNRGVTPAMQGGNVMGAMGAGQQVVDRALATADQLPAEAYQRIVKDALPEVQAAYSARGLGSTGAAARGEQDYIQRTRDALFQKDVANQLAALQTGAAASGAAASQAIGAQNAAIGRGQLGLQASQSIPQQLAGFQDIAGAPMNYMSQFAGLQSAPIDLASQALNLYGMGANMPLQYQQMLYNFTRQPQLDLLTQLSGTQQANSRNWNFGAAYGSSAGGGGGGQTR